MSSENKLKDRGRNVVDILILTAIIIELAVLLHHTRRMMECDAKLDEHIEELGEHMAKMDEHIAKMDEHIARLDEHIERIDAALELHSEGNRS